MREKMAKMLSLLLCIATVAAYSVPALAATEGNTGTNESQTQAEQEQSAQEQTTDSTSAKTSNANEESSGDSSDTAIAKNTSDATEENGDAEESEESGDEFTLPYSDNDGNIAWTIDENGKMTISPIADTAAMEDYDGNSAPWKDYKEQITSVVFEDGITKIGKDAFNEKCSKLESISIPSTVTEISGYAFFQCTALKNVDLPSSVQSIGYASFGDCTSLEEITINNDSIDIANGAFLNIMKTITIRCNTDSTALKYAVSNSINVEFISSEWEANGTLSDTVTWKLDNTGLLTISGTGKMPDYSDPGVFPEWKTKGYRNFIKSVRIEDGITSIGSFVFFNASNLTSVTMPDTVTEIGAYAFDNCGELATITMSTTLETLGIGTFTKCVSLKEVTLPDSLQNIGEDAFEDCSNVTLICEPDSAAATYAKDNSITWRCKTAHTYGDYVIDTDSTCTKVGSKHRDCENCGYRDTEVVELKDHDWSDTYTVDKEATPFEEGSESRHCKNCDATTDARAIAKLPEISGESGDLTWTLTQDGTIEFKGEGAMADYERNGDSEIAPWTSDEYAKYIKKIKIDEGVTTIGKYAFAYCENVESVSLPSTLTTISLGAFYGLHSIKEITIPASVTSIDADAFGYNLALTKVYIKGENVEFHKNAFRRYTATSGKVTLVSTPTATAKAFAEENEFTTWECAHVWKTYTQKAGYLKNGTSYSQCTLCGEKKNVKTLAGYSKYIVKKLKVKKGKKSFKVSWKKASKANKKVISGYQIRYSKKSSMASSKYVKVSKTSKGKTIKKLSKKTKYYVQVRNYMKKGGKTYYSKWSAKKTVKTK